jgi:hypothetical protein
MSLNKDIRQVLDPVDAGGSSSTTAGDALVVLKLLPIASVGAWAGKKAYIIGCYF